MKSSNDGAPSETSVSAMAISQQSLIIVRVRAQTHVLMAHNVELLERGCCFQLGAVHINPDHSVGLGCTCVSAVTRIDARRSALCPLDMDPIRAHSLVLASGQPRVLGISPLGGSETRRLRLVPPYSPAAELFMGTTRTTTRATRRGLRRRLPEARLRGDWGNELHWSVGTALGRCALQQDRAYRTVYPIGTERRCQVRDFTIGYILHGENSVLEWSRPVDECFSGVWVVVTAVATISSRSWRSWWIGAFHRSVAPRQEGPMGFGGPPYFEEGIPCPTRRRVRTTCGKPSLPTSLRPSPGGSAPICAPLPSTETSGSAPLSKCPTPCRGARNGARPRPRRAP